MFFSVTIRNSSLENYLCDRLNVGYAPKWLYSFMGNIMIDHENPGTLFSDKAK